MFCTKQEKWYSLSVVFFCMFNIIFELVKKDWLWQKKDKYLNKNSQKYYIKSQSLIQESISNLVKPLIFFSNLHIV